ncbi:tape measure protein [Anaerostipes caccae]|uniref:tape measure protein n=1 Tax=Anaerostipes caccae TaxID=105841 RepID=UPI00164E1AF9|nr:tape measure protein [Anaerostipes caccae]
MASEGMVNTSSIDSGAAAIERAAQSANRTEQEMNQVSSATQRMQQELRGVGQHTQNNTNYQNNYNKSVNDGSSAVSFLLGKAKTMATTLGAAFGAKQVIGLSDTMASSRARLDLMNDGLQTTEQLQNMIYQSAQRSRGSYQDTADIVSKLGTSAKGAFKSNEEAVLFAEQMNKQFVIGGASAQEQSAAMYQLTQAMASGRLQGDEFRSIMENAPMLAQSIAQSLGKSTAELREMSSEGLLTSDVIKNALFASADETNRKFEQMPKTFSQVMASVKNQALRAFHPVLNQINKIANSKKFDSFINGAVGAINTIGSVAAVALGAIVTIGAFMSDNWSIIGPIVYGIAGALMLYYGRLFLINNAEKIHAGIMAIKNGAMIAAVPIYSLLTGQTMAQTAAQWGLNTALLACPITWIIIAIVALIAIFYAAVAAVNKFAGTSYSATGILVGVFATAGAFIGNTVIGVVNAVITWFVTLWNFIAAFANFFANVFNDPVAAIEHLFLNLFNCILDIVSGAADLIDKITGSNLSGSIDGFQNKVNKWAQNKIPEQKEYVKTLDPDKYTINKRIAYGDAYKAGYDWGKNLGKSKKVKTPKVKNPKIPDYGKIVKDPSSTATAANTGKTAANTAKTANSVSATQEDLSYLRDIAEQEAINQITSPIINVEMTNNNTVNSGMDLDGISSMLRSKVEEEMYASAEGVY